MITKVVSRRKITALLNRGESLKTTKKRRRKTTEDRIDPSHHTFRFEGSRALKSILEVVRDEIRVIKNAMPHTTVIPPRKRGSFIIDKISMPRGLAFASTSTSAGAAGGAEALGAVGAGADIFYSSSRMKAYHMYFFFLKFLLVIQTVLILLQKENPNQISYIASDVLFKLSLGIFLMIFFTFKSIEGLDVYDRFIASFAGALLTFDAVYISLPILLTKMGVKLPSWVVVQRV